MEKRSVVLIFVLSFAVVFSMASNCPAPVCGDAILQPDRGEQCEPGDEWHPPIDEACPGQCLPDCTCLPEPVCGDNIVNRTEEVCDGTDDEACPGECLPDCTCPPPTGGEGCTPGYWKQIQHFGSWTVYTPTMKFADVFGNNAFGEMTLLQVLWQGGGGLKALGRHTVAALLNAASDISYDITDPQDVIDAFNDVSPGGDHEGLKCDFADFNEQYCPLGRALMP